MIHLNNLDPSLRGLIEGSTLGKQVYCAKSDGNTYAYLRDDRSIKSNDLTVSLPEALTKMTTTRNDTIFLSPDNHTLSAVIDWSLNSSKLIGMSPPTRMNNRARIGHDVVASPLITISGYGNEIRNLYTMHGYGSGADYIGWLISGARNNFYNVHFGGPMQATQAGHASYEGVAIDGSESYFKDCTFGTDSIGRDETSPNVTLGAGTKTIFEDCLFLASLTDGDPVFVKVENTTNYTWALFKNCSFMAFNANYATPMTVAFTISGGASCAMVLHPDCVFQNVSALVDTAKDQHIYLPRAMSTVTDTEGLISVQLTI